MSTRFRHGVDPRRRSGNGRGRQLRRRFLLNDACAKLGIPWIYSGVISSYGMTMTIRPGETACLRCLLGAMPAPGTTATCDTAGVLAPSVSVVASIAAGEAIKLLAGFGELNDGLINFDLLDNSLEQFEVQRRADCATCGQANYEFLNAEAGARTVTLCGRNAVQISVPGGHRLDLDALAAALRRSGIDDVAVNPYLLRARITDLDLTIFPDARAIIKGTEDRSLCRLRGVREVCGNLKKSGFTEETRLLVSRFQFSRHSLIPQFPPLNHTLRIDHLRVYE